VWNLETGARRIDLPGAGWWGATARSPDGRLIAETRRWPHIRLYDASDGRVRGIAEAPGRDPRLPFIGLPSLAFSPAGQTIATATEDGQIRLWKVADFLESEEHGSGGL